MSFADRLRTAGLVRGAAVTETAAPARVATAVSRRHPAMAGIVVPPVHGHHCICDRCMPQERRTAA